MLSERQFDRIGDIVSTVGSRDFGSVFYNVFADMLGVQDCTVFSFIDDSTPESMVAEGHCDERRQLARRLSADYVTSGFLDDPNVHRCDGPCSSTYVVTARDLQGTAYGEHYYGESNLGSKLVVQGRTRDTLYYTSFYRTNEVAEFDTHEVEVMGALSNFIVKTLHRHRELVSPVETGGFNFVARQNEKPADLRDRTLNYLREVLISGSHGLSAREAEVCAGIVMGYSTLAIGLNCSISPNTVATHRKRAYAKMGISSQNELFVRYFSTVRDFQVRETQQLSKKRRVFQ